MKLKKEPVLLVLIIAALAVYLVMRDSDRTRYRLPEMPDMQADAVTKIEVHRQEASMSFEKKGTQWILAPKGYRVDPTKMNRILNALESMTVTDLVSESGNYMRYDLSPDKKISVKVWTGEVLAQEFDIGKVARTFRHTYIRWMNDPNVYHATGHLRDAMEHPESYFRDRTVLSFHRKDIQELQITRKGLSFSVSRESVPAGVDAMPSETGDPPSLDRIEWRRSDGEKLEHSALDPLFSLLSNLTCQEYMSDTTAQDLAPSICSITLKGHESYFLNIFDKKDKDATGYPAVSIMGESAFILSDSIGDRILAQVDEIGETSR